MQLIKNPVWNPDQRSMAYLDQHLVRHFTDTPPRPCHLLIDRHDEKLHVYSLCISLRLWRSGCRCMIISKRRQNEDFSTLISVILFVVIQKVCYWVFTVKFVTGSISTHSQCTGCINLALAITSLITRVVLNQSDQMFSKN